VVSDLVRDDVGLGEIALCREFGFELAEEREVDVQLAIVRAVERTGREYPPPYLVLFDDGINTGCGYSRPAREKIAVQVSSVSPSTCETN